jgi:hypothetical protein
MSDLHHTGRRSVLAGIGAAALAASFNRPLVLAQAAAQPQYVGKDLSAVADQIIARNGPRHR